MRKTFPESSHGLGERKQDLRVVSHREPNDVLNDMVLTSGYDGDLENMLMECGGGEKSGEEGGGRSGVLQSWVPPRVDCGLHYKRQRGACSICVTHVPGGVAPGVVTRSGRTWARPSSCKPLDTERRLEGYRTHLWVCRRPWECAHGGGSGAGGESAVQDATKPQK